MLKIGHLGKALAHAKVLAFAKWSVWVKNCEKPFYNYIRVVLSKNPLERAPKILEVR